MLGYSSGGATVQSWFGPVADTFGMDNVQCIGNETSILDCPHVTVDDCGPFEGAGVICTNLGMFQFLVRLLEMYIWSYGTEPLLQEQQVLLTLQHQLQPNHQNQVCQTIFQSSCQNIARIANAVQVTI